MADGMQLHPDEVEFADAPLHFPAISPAVSVRADAGKAKKRPGCFAQSSAMWS
jgi:hypothetical protein